MLGSRVVPIAKRRLSSMRPMKRLDELGGQPLAGAMIEGYRPAQAASRVVMKRFHQLRDLGFGLRAARAGMQRVGPPD